MWPPAPSPWGPCHGPQSEDAFSPSPRSPRRELRHLAPALSAHELGAERTQASEPPSRPRHIPRRWRRRKETGWDAGPAGKGEAEPGRATRDASPASGPLAGGQRPACGARPTGTSRVGLLLELLGALGPPGKNLSHVPVCLEHGVWLESGARSDVTAACSERD